MSTENHDENGNTQTGFEHDLTTGLNAAWRMIEEGVTQRRSPFHLMTVATIDSDGNPQARTVVLRGCDVEGRWLRFNTDRRSPKIRDLANDPRATLLLYGAAEKLQIRLQVRLEVVDDAERDAIWSATPSYSRECYQVTTAPGADVDSPESTQFDPSKADGGREHFAPIRARVEALEWLYLSAKRHRRARYVFTDSGVEARWVVP